MSLPMDCDVTVEHSLCIVVSLPMDCDVTVEHSLCIVVLLPMYRDVTVETFLVDCDVASLSIVESF